MQKSILHLDKKQGPDHIKPYSKIIMGGGYTYNYKLIITKFSFQIVFTPTDLQGTDIMPFPANFILHTVLVTGLIDVFKNELDKTFFGIEFSDTENHLSTEEYIKLKTQVKTKYKFLILVNDNNTYKTRLKNRIHRSILLEIVLQWKQRNNYRLSLQRQNIQAKQRIHNTVRTDKYYF